MTDKELLTFAAKAAGLVAERYIEGHGLSVYDPACGTGSNSFNPLEDDGDALRLANKLQLTVQIGRLDGTVVVTSNNDDSIYSSESWLPGEASDKATRRAIVCAAAEIGKAKVSAN